ncbi:hypothetical protein [Streptomyces acidiscabies]|uniref:hypothetical protein n=1 Tax=Streptomyces acidiscabies TaxID=42234 RepID=UPI0038F746D0
MAWQDRFRLRRPLRRRGEPDSREVPHLRETRSLTEALHLYEAQVGEEFDERVARESGTYGWETFSLVVLLVGALVCALITALNGLAVWAYGCAGFAGLCGVVVGLRSWAAVRRGRRSQRGGEGPPQSGAVGSGA